MQHRIEPVRHGADQSDQRFCVGWMKSLTTGNAPEWVVAAPLPQFNPVGELILQTQLMAGPEHGLSAVQVQGLGGEQQKIQLFNASSAESRNLRGRGLGHGSDDARVPAIATPGFGPFFAVLHVCSQKWSSEGKDV